MRHVLITRPEPGATVTADAVRALGLEPVLLPLTEIVPLPQDMPTDAFDAVAVTSANALRHAVKTTLQPLSHLPCRAIGAATAEAASRVGFSKISQAEGGGSDLVDQIARATPRGARIAYLCGRVRLPVFEAGLSAAGLCVTPIETYDTRPLSYSDAELDRILAHPIDCALVYSALAADGLGVLAGRPGLAERFAGTNFFCISARVASHFDARFSGRIYAAPRPDDDALISML